MLTNEKVLINIPNKTTLKNIYKSEPKSAKRIKGVDVCAFCSVLLPVLFTTWLNYSLKLMKVNPPNSTLSKSRTFALHDNLYY